jgi:hypothetical protein
METYQLWRLYVKAIQLETTTSRMRVEGDREALEGLRRLIRAVKAKAALQEKSVHPVRVGDDTFREIVYWLEEMEVADAVPSITNG